MRIEVEECPPCEYLNAVLAVKKTNYGVLIKYEPNIPHKNGYNYEWTFGSNVYTTREVYLNSHLPGILKVYDITSDDCCEVRVKV